MRWRVHEAAEAAEILADAELPDLRLLDFEGTLEGAESQPFYLRPRDIVYVSRTPIADVNQWVDQYIDGIIPGALWMRWPVVSARP